MSDEIAAAVITIVAGQLVAVIGSWVHMLVRLKAMEVRQDNHDRQLANYVEKTEKLTDAVSALVVELAKQSGRR